MAVLTDKEYKRLTEEFDKVAYTCKCGHRVVIPHNKTKMLCRWCNNYVFKSKEDEFKYRIKEKLK